MRNLDNEDFLENSHILSCFDQPKGVLINFFCALNLSFFLSERRQSTFCQIALKC